MFYNVGSSSALNLELPKVVINERKKIKMVGAYCCPTLVSYIEEFVMLSLGETE